MQGILQSMMKYTDMRLDRYVGKSFLEILSKGRGPKK